MTLSVSGLPTARADIQNPGRSSFPGDRKTQRQGERPPNAVPQAISVVQDGTVSIVLRARGHAGESVDFLIRTPPAHGTLDGEPRQITLNSAVVAYTPRPGDDATDDAFTFAVQTRGSAVSAEVRVTVRIQEPAPVLAISPAELDFGAVKAGNTTRAEVTLTNQGGGEATGHLEPPPPWIVDGSSEYSLPRGASQTFGLVFKPQVERAYAEAMHFRYETGGGVRLIGTGLAGTAVAALEPEVALVGHPLSPRVGPGAVSEASQVPAAVNLPQPTPVPGVLALPVASTVATPASGTGQGVMPSMPATDTPFPETNDGGVASFAIRDRGRTTLDLRWRPPIPAPKGYRVELRYLSLDQDDRLVVDWRPYARVEFHSAQGYVTARLSGLSPDSQQCLRVVAVTAAGRLTTPSPLLVAYTLPPSTWWRPTPLKVLFLLLVICGGLILRGRWETSQILREIDESRRRTSMSQ